MNTMNTTSSTATAALRERRASLLSRDEPFVVIGRISRLRLSTGASFADVIHRGRLIQIGATRSREPEALDFIRSLSCGDMIRVSGPWLDTRSGDRALFPSTFSLLAHCPMPFPSWQEPASEETARTNPDLARAGDPERAGAQLSRYMVIAALRQWAFDEGLMETPVPVLCPVASGACANPFSTRLDATGREYNLRIAHENELIRLICSGFDAIYEMGPAFRNEGISSRHNPEFWLLEAYRIGWTWRDALGAATRCIQQAREALELPPMETPSIWTIDRAWTEFGGEESSFSDFVMMRNALAARCSRPDPDDMSLRWQYLDECMVPPSRPFALIGQPIAISPLARWDPELGGAARFELFIDGVEIANGYEQCTDQGEQARRFAEQAARRGSGAETMPLDELYLGAMSMGMPPIGGFGIGVDRLAQRLTNSDSLRNVLPFPITGS